MKQEVFDKITELIATAIVEYFQTVMTKHNIQWDKQPLGKVTDEKLAKKLKVHNSTVYRQRKKRGIKSAKSIRGAINWDTQPLGKITDSALAKQLHVSITAVRYQRIRRNVPVYSKPRRKKT